MRKLFALLLIAVAGYCLYTHQELWRKYFPGNAGTAGSELKEPVAWKVVSRTASGSPDVIEVSLMDGDRWRLESRKPGTSKIFTAVCDGSSTVANPPGNGRVSPNMLDPRPMAKIILESAARVSDVANKTHSQATELLDGHACWKLTETFSGFAGQMWVDSRTGYPVCVVGTVNGGHIETHFSKLPVDFADSRKYFDTKNTAPMFASYLADDLPVPAVPASLPVAAIAPAARTRYILTGPVTITTSYGAVTVPAKTEVSILRRTGNVCRVSGAGQEFDVRDDQLAAAQ